MADLGKTAVVAIVAVLALTGCTRDISDVAEARDECRSYGGVFTSWKHDLGYSWECDLSDEVKK